MTSAFTLDGVRRIDSLRIEVQAYHHVATGARHFHLAADDDNNAFLVAFPTIPGDSTGVAHILEHTALCGSRRYPVRDPFFMMLRRSLNTFMNAFTGSDSTAYPFATRNRKDFDNLLAIYLDAVFFPNLDPLDFAQEGCRVELADADREAALVYKGVVYNEMKGAMSSPVAQLWQHVQAALFPDTPYRFNSGGDPAEIPSLTHAQLKAFHARHYHPSQAVFITYGNFPVLEHQARFEALALARFARSDQIIVSQGQPRLGAPRHVTTTYAVDGPGDLADTTHVVWGWLLGEATDPRTLLEAHLLSGVLLEHSASPLRHYLETTPYAKAPSELCGLDDSARQLAFLCGVEGTEASHAGRLETDILALLGDLARDGVPRTMLDAALDRLEMAQRDISGDHFPYGLQLMTRMLPGAMHRADPVSLLDIDALLATLREEAADPGWFRTLLRRLLLDNPHRVRVTMTPDLHKRDAEQAAERARLAALAATLDAAHRAELAHQAAALAERQARHDDPDLLPRITLADVPAGIAPVTGTTDVVGGRHVTRYLRGTNGILHAQWVYALPALDAEELAALPLFAAWVLELGMGQESYLETQARRAQIGSFAASAVVRGHLSDPTRHHGRLVVSAKGLRRHAAALTTTPLEILAGARFDETERLRDLIAQTRADLEMGVTDRGHQLAMHGAARGLSRGGWLNDLWDGPTNLRDVQRLDAAADADPTRLHALFATFGRLRERVLAGTPQVLLVGEADAIAMARDALLELPGAPPAEAATHFGLPDIAPAAAAAWTVNADVNFCAKAYLAVPEGHPDAPALSVLARYLTDGFLHAALREKGGAYGGGASFDSDSGCFFFYSYRDPRLADTLADFDRALDWFMQDADSARLEESILGVIRTLDKPRSPAGAAIDAFHSAQQGRTPEFRAGYRSRALGITHADLRAAAGRYLVPARGAVGIVTHRGEAATMDALGLDVEAL
ncbi:MAG: insulinase family protein [Gammaproteobacteria bacterium]